MARGRGKYRLFSEGDKAEMVRLRGQGLGPAEIGRRIGRPTGAVSDWFKRQRDLRSDVPRVKTPVTLPVSDGGGFLKAPTRAQLMAGR